MSGLHRQQILRLYKDILRYGQQLQYTDKSYFYQRISDEFKKNKNESESTQMNFLYEVCSISQHYLLCQVRGMIRVACTHSQETHQSRLDFEKEAMYFLYMSMG